MANFNGMAAIETPEFMASVKDKLGTVDAYNHYSVGWAWAMCTPYQWTKQVASHWGGTRNGTIVHWPAGITGKAGIRSQFCHVIDVAPTILEAAGLPEPDFVNGVQQSPIEGTSMIYTFDDPDAPERHDLQYFEMAGNRGIYFKGWSAVTRHSTPWLPHEVLPALDDDVWELYDGNNDWSQSRDLAAEQPDRLAKLQRLWLIEAVKYNVLPIDDRRFERLNATIAGRPQLITGTSQVLFPGMKRLSEGSVIDIKNRSFSVTASIDAATDGPTNGVIIAQGGKFGGWALFFEARPGEVRLQPARHAGIRHRGHRGPRRRATTRSAPSSPTTAAVSRRAAPSPCTTTARRRHRAGRRHPAADLLRGRNHRHRQRLRHAGQRRLRRRQQVQRPHRRRPDRRRRRRPVPPHRPGTGRHGRHLPAMTAHRASDDDERPPVKGMVLVPGGTETIGSLDFYPEERPLRDVQVADLWVDEHPVTNAQFRRFVKDTGHVTVAEQAPDPADFPGRRSGATWCPDPRCSSARPDRCRWTTGPAGGHGFPARTGGIPKGPAAPCTAASGTPSSTSDTRTPWPTRSGRTYRCPPKPNGNTPPAAACDQAIYPWGDEFSPGGKVMANTWHGRFPYENLATRPAPTRTITGETVPAQRLRPVRRGRQRLGMDQHAVDRHRTTDRPAGAGQLLRTESAALTEEDRFVTKGGSHLCAPVLLSPLPPGRPAGPRRPQHHNPPRVSLRDQTLSTPARQQGQAVPVGIPLRLCAA